VKRVCIVGASGSGKTTLMVKLVSHLARRGLRVGTLKHSHHDFEMDRSGKDSYRHYHAGAAVSGIVSPTRTAVFGRTKRRAGLRDLAPYFRGCDLLLLEGFRGGRLPKIEVYRKNVSPEPLYLRERFRIRALVTGDPHSFSGPVFRPDEVARLARFVLGKL
jgi:molybdopterin-guanine dinucleotide biosynthesis protein MobB